MIGQTLGDDCDVAGDRDDPLSGLLRQHASIEPGTRFEAEVWRRIRAAPGVQPVDGAWSRWTGWFQLHPVWTGVAAASVALAIGLLAGLTMDNRGRSASQTHALLHPRTLMGAYLVLSVGGRP